MVCGEFVSGKDSGLLRDGRAQQALSLWREHTWVWASIDATARELWLALAWLCVSLGSR